ncbi:MAG: polymer-forming cytoskeletal protein [Anaerolineales bacterium]|nr:polymer-forming cytoskeletal protein [Anaerolineales bacterium]
MKLKLLFVVFLLALLVVPWQSVAASDGSFDGQIIFGQSFTLESGKTLEGDLLVFGGMVEIQEKALVNGDVVLFGGLLTLDGTVNGNVSVTGGQVSLGPTAHITGDLITVGATLEKAETARVDGELYLSGTMPTGNLDELTPTPWPIPDVPSWSEPRLSPFEVGWGILGRVFNVFLQAIGLTALSMVLMLFLAPQTGRVAQAAVSQPWIAGLLGLLTVILSPFALLLLTITLILIPVAVLAAFLLALAGLFGWIALGYEIGERFTRAIRRTWHPSFSAGLGVFVLTLLSSALNSIPGLSCVGWVFPTLLGLLGLGAVIMTRFGTQTVTQAPPKVETPET